MKILIALSLFLSCASVARAAQSAVEPGAVEAASAIQAHLAVVPQNGGVLDPAALLSTIQGQLSAPGVGEAEVESGMAVLRYMTDSSVAAGVDQYLRTARTAQNPALGRRTADALDAWFAAVHKAKAQEAFVEAERKLSLRLAEIGMLDAEQLAAAMDGSAARAGTVASRAKERKAAAKASRLTLGQRARSLPGWDHVGRVAGHPAWSHAGTAAWAALPAAAGGSAAAFLDPLLHIGAMTMNGMLVEAAAASGVLLAFDVLLGLRASSRERKLSAWVPAMNGFLLGALFLALSGLLSFSPAQLLAGGALTLAAAFVLGGWRDGRSSVPYVLGSLAAGALAALALLPLLHSAIPATILGALVLIGSSALHVAWAWIVAPVLSLLMMITVSAIFGMIGGMLSWVLLLGALGGGAWLFFRRSLRRS